MPSPLFEFYVHSWTNYCGYRDIRCYLGWADDWQKKVEISMIVWVPIKPHLYHGYIVREGGHRYWGRWSPWPLHSFKSARLQSSLSQGIAFHPPSCLNQNLRITLYTSFSLISHIHSITKYSQLNLLISLRIHAVHHFSWFYTSQATAVSFMDHYNSLLKWSRCFHSPYPLSSVLKYTV